jgi:succinate dehydrogenase / fumarate reductase cytochrome b subunit
VNATIAQYGQVFQVQVDKIHSLPFLAAVEWTLIYLPILYHTVYGIWITVTGQPNVNRYPYTKNVFYTLQRISAIVIVMFMFFHVFSLKMGWFGSRLTFDPHNAAYSVHQHMTANPIIPFLIYPLGILASCYHLANGFWTAAITWGLTISKGAQKRWGYACAGLFVITFIFGMTALVASLNSRLAENPATKPTIHLHETPAS